MDVKFSFCGIEHTLPDLTGTESVRRGADNDRRNWPPSCQVYEALRSGIVVTEQRAKEYNTGGTSVSRYFLGTAGYMQMVHIKYLRLLTLFEAGKTPAEMRDSCLDLMNYAAFMLCHLDEEQKPLMTGGSE